MSIRRKYSVFRDNYAEPVLETQEYSRAVEAMDSMFDRGYDLYKPNCARIECSGEVIEKRRADRSLKMLVEEPAEHHHHAAPYIPHTPTLPEKKQMPRYRRA